MPIYGHTYIAHNSVIFGPIPNIFPPPIAFFVLQKGIEGGLEEIVVCGVVCIVYSILPLRVLLNLKQVLLLHVGKKCVVVVECATLSLADRYLL